MIPVLHFIQRNFFDVFATKVRECSFLRPEELLFKSQTISYFASSVAPYVSRIALPDFDIFDKRKLQDVLDCLLAETRK